MPIVKNYQGKDVEVPEEPRRHRSGCICPTPTVETASGWNWQLRNDCPYHQDAAAQPWNHTIPWNCPTFYDGCNCDGGPYFP